MTVEKAYSGSYGDSMAYSCTWFSGAKHNNQRISEEALQEYSEDKE